MVQLQEYFCHEQDIEAVRPDYDEQLAEDPNESLPALLEVNSDESDESFPDARSDGAQAPGC